MAGPVLVLDLDGTVCLGDAPVRDYARAVEQLAPQATGLAAELDDFLRDPHAREDLRPAQDGYQAVQLLSDRVGVDPATRDRAYALSREILHDEGRRGGAGAVSAPEGLAAVLGELGVHAVLVTNAPGDGLDRLLERLGVAARLAEVRPSAGKPAGMRRLLADLLAGHGLADDPAQLLSVGDIWRNDLAPALELGCATAYVDTWGRAQGPAHVSAPTLPELYPALREWAGDPAGFVRRHPLPELSCAGPDRPGLD